MWLLREPSGQLHGRHGEAGAGRAVAEAAARGGAAGAAAAARAALAERERRLQVGHDVGHRRPVLALEPHAVHGRVRHQLHGLGLVRRRLRRAPVQHLAELPGHDARLRVVHHAHRAPALGLLEDGALPRQRLQHHHAEAVHVALHGEVVQAVVLRVHVPHRAGGLHGQVLRLRLRAARLLRLRRPHQRQPEVRHARHPPAVQQDVGRLDVAVDDGRHGVRVQVLDAPRRVQQDLDAQLPRRHHRRRRVGVRAAALGVEVVVERAVLHVLVHQQPLVVLLAVADEADEVLVVEPGEEGQLRPERALLLLELARHWPRRLAALDGDLAAVGELAAVHRAEAPRADLGLRLEAVRRRRQLRERVLLGVLLEVEGRRPAALPRHGAGELPPEEATRP
uniref:Uncharacterized protein n=1 Tax=Triticum urartu TaxID=4572 RepID=A0A8R7JX13_TRIUA